MGKAERILVQDKQALGGVAVITCLSGAIWRQHPQPQFVSLMWKICPLTRLRKYTRTIKMPHNGNVY